MPSFGPARLGDQLSALLPPDATGILVAFSGGADSTALMLALSALRQAGGLDLRLRAVHVDHGLQSASRAFASQCRRVARRLRIPLALRRIEVPLQSGQSIEAAARAARRDVFAAVLRPRECLLLAQHADDQLETFLLQALRGAGVAGLASMPERQGFAAGWMLRPLLPWSREDLRAWLETQEVGWVEDPTNADPRFDRNYLRNSVLPGIVARWPAAAATVARSARLAAQASAVLKREGTKDAESAAVGPDLEIAILRRLGPERQRQALRAWLARRDLPLPDEDRLIELQRLLDVRDDAQPCVRWPGVEIRRHDGLLVAIEPRPPSAGGVRLDWRWRHRRRLDLPDGGSLELRDDPHGDIDIGKLPDVIQVGLRGDLGRRTTACDLKSLLRESRVPVWQRDGVPLLFDGANLVAVADLWFEAALKPGPGVRHRGRFVWRRR